MDDNENEDCIPILTDANQGLEANEVVDYLVEAATKHNKSCIEPACSTQWRNSIFIRLGTK